MYLSTENYIFFSSAKKALYKRSSIWNYLLAYWYFVQLSVVRIVKWKRLDLQSNNIRHWYTILQRTSTMSLQLCMLLQILIFYPPVFIASWCSQQRISRLLLIQATRSRRRHEKCSSVLQITGESFSSTSFTPKILALPRSSVSNISFISLSVLQIHRDPWTVVSANMCYISKHTKN